MVLAAWACVLGLFPQAAESKQVEEGFEDGSRLEYRARVTPGGEQLPNGSFVVIDAEGKRRILGKFKLGTRHGSWRYRSQGGRPWINGEFKDGLREGRWEYRFPSKAVRAKGLYRQGLPSGEWSFVDEAGKPDELQSGTYRALTASYPNGTSEYRGTLLDHTLHGPWTFNWQSGSPRLHAWFERGEPVGSWRFWHPDGSLDAELLTHEFRAPAYQPELFAEPVLAAGGAAAEAFRASMLNPLPMPAGGEWKPPMLEPPKAEVQQLIQACLAGDEAEQAAARGALASGGRDALGGLLLELDALEAARALEGPKAAELFELATLVFRGHRLLEPEHAEDPLRVLQARMRAHSLYELTRDSPGWWALELDQVPHASEATGERCVLLRPSFLPAALQLEVLQAGPYGARFSSRERLDKQGGRGTTRALEAALDWLARNQEPDGRWAAPQVTYDLGVTCLALLALLGNGNTLEHGAHREVVQRGVRWLLGTQEPKTGRFLYRVKRYDEKTKATYFVSSFDSLYGHAVASLVLAELVVLSPSERLRDSLRAALGVIDQARNQYSAWGYHVPGNGESDTSMTGWMVAALTSARRAGFEVPPGALEDAVAWFDNMTHPATGRVGYRDMGGRSARQAGVNEHFPRELTEALTAVGLWSRFLLGQDPSKVDQMQKHASLLLGRLPSWDWERSLSNDMYYWYMGTYAMRHMGGTHWKRWNLALKQALIEPQLVEGPDRGSWDPNGTWCQNTGRVYSTAMLALCLEAYFRFGDPASQGD